MLLMGKYRSSQNAGLVRNLAICIHLKQRVYKLRDVLCRNTRASTERIVGIGVNMERALWLCWDEWSERQTCCSEAPLKSMQ